MSSKVFYCFHLYDKKKLPKSDFRKNVPIQKKMRGLCKIVQPVLGIGGECVGCKHVWATYIDHAPFGQKMKRCCSFTITNFVEFCGSILKIL